MIKPLAFCGWMAFTLVTNATGQIASLQVVPEANTISLDPIADQTHGFLKWTHGAFLYQESNASGAPPSFSTLNREGQLTASVTLNVPGGAKFWSSAADRGIDGSIIFAGGTFSSYGEAAPFIARISSDGKTERIIRTAPYFPHMISAAPDGTVWVVGCEMKGHKVTALELNPDAPVLRHFDGAGNLLGGVSPQSQFVVRHQTARLQSGFLVATRDRVGWYSPSWGKDSEYVELSMNSMTWLHYPGLPDLPTGSQVLGFTLTEAGNASLSLYDVVSHQKVTYLLDRSAYKWIPIQVPVTARLNHPLLMGSDGEQFVFQSGSSAAFLNLSR